MATIYGSRRAVLVGPYFTRYGGLELKVGSPEFSTCTLRARGLMPDVPWDVEATAEVEYIRVASNALTLWYGERGRPVEPTETGYRATFDWHTVAYDTIYGSLVTMQHIESPRLPALGKYHFNLYPLATLILPEPMSILAAHERAIAVDGFFDLLASFPRRSLQVKVRLRGWDTFLEMRVALNRARDVVDDHPYNVFIKRDQGIGVGQAFSRYLDGYKDRRLLQRVLRYLSATKLMVPDGFLTACNVIESLGKPDPDTDTVLKGELDAIESHLRECAPAQGARFGELRKKINLGSSFAARFRNVASSLSTLGLDITLKPGVVAEARGRHRHDIKSLTDKDMEAMQAAVGFAWVAGLVWMCRSIGVPDEIMRASLRNEIFHRMRGTQLWRWGKVQPATNATGSSRP